jgi:alpha-mannosidase
MLTDRAHGWNHPSPHRLALSLLHTPAVGRRFPFQGWQDLGRHSFRFALAGHAGDWRAADVPSLAARFRQPPLAFVAEAPGAGHAGTRGDGGSLGRSWSFLAAEPGAQVSAVKRHEDGEEWVVRWLDPTGRGDGRITLPATVATCRPLDGCEDDPAAGEVEVAVAGRRVSASAPRHRPVTLGLTLRPPVEPLAAARHEPVVLPLSRTVVTRQGEACSGGLGRRGWAFPAELLPEALDAAGIRLELPAAGAGAAQAVACEGQRVLLPHDAWDRLWLLAASGDGEQAVAFRTPRAEHLLVVQDAFAPLSREDQAVRLAIWGWGLWRVRPGFARRAAVAWVGNHCHDRAGRDVPYQPAALFLLSLPLAPGEREVTLPNAPTVLLLAATASAGTGHVSAAF